MNINNSINQKLPIMPLAETGAKSSKDGDGNPLSKAADSAFDLIFKATSEAHREASATTRELTAQLMTGQIDDLASFMVETQKSSMLFELNLNMRNKVLDAYQEVLKTQI